MRDDVAAVLARVYADAEDSAIPKKFRKDVLRVRTSKPANPDPQYKPERPVARVRKKKLSPTGLKRGENLRGTSSIRHTGTKYDRKVIFEKFDSGLRISEIARELGAPQSSIRDIIRSSGRVSGKSGPRPKEKCKRGHSLAKFGKPASNGGRYCSECKRQSQRKVAA